MYKPAKRSLRSSVPQERRDGYEHRHCHSRGSTLPEDAPWLADFQREVSLFPNGKHDDQVDSLSQFLIWFAEPVSMPNIRFL